MTDAAGCVIGHMMCGLREAFAPNSEIPPLGPGGDVVRFFAGDATPLAAWDFHTNDDECGCDKPFLWVRLARRYRSITFPAPVATADSCGAPKAIALEIGVGRCAEVSNTGFSGEWTDLAREAEVSLDDSWRIDLALCRGLSLAKDHGCALSVAINDVLPYGPEGGVFAWLGTGFAQLD